MADFGYKSDMLVIAPTNSVMQAQEPKTREYHELHDPLNADSRKLSHVGVSQNPTGEI